jgi:hypothetical protein
VALRCLVAEIVCDVDVVVRQRPAARHDFQGGLIVRGDGLGDSGTTQGLTLDPVDQGAASV